MQYLAGPNVTAPMLPGCGKDKYEVNGWRQNFCLPSTNSILNYLQSTLTSLRNKFLGCLSFFSWGVCYSLFTLATTLPFCILYNIVVKSNFDHSYYDWLVAINRWRENLKPTEKSHLSAIRLLPLIGSHEVISSVDMRGYEAERPWISQYLSGFSGDFDARGDYEAALKFLKSYSDSPATFKNYRTQVERLLLWAWGKRKKSFRDFLRSDVEDFLSFCRAPDPTWVSESVKTRFETVDGLPVPNPEWRPFSMRTQKSASKVARELNREAPPPVFRMSDNSHQLIGAVLNSLFTYCNADQVMATNPCAMLKRSMRKNKSKELKIPVNRSLTKLQWEVLLDTAELMATEQPPSGERALFCIVMMFGCYLRAGDLAGNGTWLPTMGSFVRDRDAWWYHVIGKGNVAAKIAVKPDCIDYLTRYRRYRGLTDLPSPGDPEPLLRTVHGRPGVQARQLRVDVQAVLDRAVERMKDEGIQDFEIDALRSASLHWLRHTGATFDAPFRNPKHLQEDLRHKSLATTQNVYYHALDDERSSEMAKLRLKR